MRHLRTLFMLTTFAALAGCSNLTTEPIEPTADAVQECRDDGGFVTKERKDVRGTLVGGWFCNQR